MNNNNNELEQINLIKIIYEILVSDNDTYIEKIDNMINNKNIDIKKLYEEIKNYIILNLNDQKIIPTMGYVYVMHTEMFDYINNNIYKLGRCINIETRLQQYSTSYFTDPAIKYLSKQVNNYVLAEKILFLLLDKYRLRKDREFFKCELDTIINTIKYIEELFEKNIAQKEYNMLINNYNDNLIEKLKQIEKFQFLEEKHENLDNVLNAIVNSKKDFDQKFKVYTKKILEYYTKGYIDQFEFKNRAENIIYHINGTTKKHIIKTKSSENIIHPINGTIKNIYKEYCGERLIHSENHILMRDIYADFKIWISNKYKNKLIPTNKEILVGIKKYYKIHTVVRAQMVDQLASKKSE